MRGVRHLFGRSLPEPRERDLDDLFAAACRFRLLAGGVTDGEPQGSTVLVESDSADDLIALRELLRFGEAGFHCMCDGDLALEIYATDGRRAVLGLHDADSYRWGDVWGSDATFTDPRGLAQFFADRGDRSMLDQQICDEEEEEESRRVLQAWLAAAPRGIPPFEVLYDERSGQMSADAHAQARGSLRAGYPSDVEAIRALLHWYGSGVGPWSGYPSYEEVAGKLLRDYPLDTLVRAIASPDLTTVQMEGAARLLAGWDFWKGRMADRSLIGPDLRARLRAQVASSDRPENLFRFDRTW